MLDYFWHLALPVTALVIGNFATITLLTKNSFLDEIGKQYVVTARAKGLTERRVLYGHVFRNAMLLVIAGLPAALLGIFFTGSLLIEVIFSLDGLGLLSFEAAMNRDYPVVFGTLFIFTLFGLVMKLISDIVSHPGRSAHRLREPGVIRCACLPSTSAAGPASRATSVAGGRSGCSSSCSSAASAPN